MKKLSLNGFSGDFDKAVAAFTLASGSAAVNYEVNIFFTFWGLNLIETRKGRKFVGKGVLAKGFGFLQGSLKNAPMSRLNLLGASPTLMQKLMKKRNVATLKELIQASIALNVNLYAREMSMNILGLGKTDFLPEVREVIVVPKFLQISEGGETMFI